MERDELRGRELKGRVVWESRSELVWRGERRLEGRNFSEEGRLM